MHPAEESRRFSRAQVALIGVALLVGALIRLLENGRPFASSDHAQLASIITFFYPRSLDMLIPSATSSWNIFTNPHGMLPSLIALPTMTLIGVVGIHINEFWWNLPFVLLNLLPIPLGALLVARVSNRGAGVAAAFLVAILPIHAALSRSCGLNIPVALNCHFITILCFMHYYANPTPRRGWLAGVALAVQLMVEMLFPVLFVLVFAVGMLTVETKPAFFLRFYRTRKLLFTPRVMVLPLAVLCLNLAIMVAYSLGWVSSGGLAARLLEGSDRQPGIYLADFWDNATYVVGTIAFPLLLILGGTMLPALWRLEKRALPLLWSLIYLLPFLAFTRPHVYEYFLFGVTPLTLNAMVVGYGWWQRQGAWRGTAAVLLPALFVLYALRAASIVYGFDVVTAVGTGKSPGGVFPDQGLKAAAWWVRSHTPPDTLVFGDSSLEPYQLWYYLRRPSLGVTDAESTEDAYLLLDELDEGGQLPAIYLVEPENVALLNAHAPEMPPLLARVTVQGEPTLLIYGEIADTLEGEPRTLEAHSANRAFDRDFGTWRAMFAIGTRQ